MAHHAWKTPLPAALLAAVLLAGCASAPQKDAQRAAAAQAYDMLNRPGVVYGHLDLWNRKQGVASYKSGNKAHALFLFKQAALYGDKPAQAMIASMYWSGDGVAQNRPLAYAWMDLAADRGYPKLLRQRELYWRALSAGQRRQALTIGKTIYAKYGDAVATKRIARNLGKIHTMVTGSHTGFAGNLEVTVLAGGLGPDVYRGRHSDGSKFYAPSATSVTAYQSLKDRAWTLPNYYNGTVTVDPLQHVQGDKAKPSTSDNAGTPSEHQP